jgi:hypothetical protein
MLYKNGYNNDLELVMARNLLQEIGGSKYSLVPKIGYPERESDKLFKLILKNCKEYKSEFKLQKHVTILDFKKIEDLKKFKNYKSVNWYNIDKLLTVIYSFNNTNFFASLPWLSKTIKINYDVQLGVKTISRYMHMLIKLGLIECTYTGRKLGTSQIESGITNLASSYSKNLNMIDYTDYKTRTTDNMIHMRWTNPKKYQLQTQHVQVTKHQDEIGGGGETNSRDQHNCHLDILGQTQKPDKNLYSTHKKEYFKLMKRYQRQ